MGTGVQEALMGGHAAEAAALGFYYQSLFALLTLVSQTADNAAVAVERLDDVEVSADGNRLLYQLKHSISETPPPVSLASRALWKTIKVWVDTLPVLTLSETTLHLVAVGHIPDDSPLKALLRVNSERTELLKALQIEAKRVINARAVAVKENKNIPFPDRADGCEAFLALSETEQHNLVRRIVIQPGSPTISEIEEKIAAHLTLLPVGQRKLVAQRLVEWWDRQIIYSLCGKRKRALERIELQHQISSIIGDIEDERLVPDFTLAMPPNDYQPDGMLTRQIELVDGQLSDIKRAVREEWRAREQRSKWVNANPGMASIINDYDLVLQEHWSDRHSQMVEECSDLEDKKKCEAGLKLLRWAHESASQLIPHISEGWSGTYYVPGSYQVLAIDLKVGWHPSYSSLLKEKE